MSHPVLSRLGRSAVTLLLLLLFTFFALRLAGDPVLQMLGPEASEAEVRQLRAALGLDRSLPVQFWHYLGGLAQGDLGLSFRDQRPVLALIGERLPATLALAGWTMLVMTLLGLGAGIAGAVWRGSRFDRGANLAVALSFATPNFFLGVLLILIFAVQLGWLPANGNGSWRHYILPVATMATAEAAVIAKFARAAVLDAQGAAFGTMARAKGVPGHRVLLRHVLPAAAAPVITILGLLAASLAGGAVITETVFGWPGLGRLLVTSVENRDLATLQGIVLLAGLLMITANLAADLAIAWLDPRLRSAA
jgi:peptide/nickel transport system permease protein